MSTKTTQLWQLNESDIVAAEVVFARRKLSDSHLQSLKGSLDWKICGQTRPSSSVRAFLQYNEFASFRASES